MSIPELLTDITLAQAGAYVVDPAYAMQRKYNGRRLMMSSQAGRQAFNKRGEPCAAELLSALPASITVDGELLRNSYAIFDLLDCLEHDLRELPYSERFALLRQAVTSGAIELPKPCFIAETWYTVQDKEKNLLRAVKERWEGVVFKKLAAPYAPGRAGQHLRLKFIKSCTARVRAVEPRSARIEMSYQDRWIEVSGVSLVGRPTVQVGDFLEVKYLYATMQSGEPHLYQPVMLHLRDDVADLDCRTEQLTFMEVE